MSGQSVRDVRAYVDEIVEEFRTGAQCMETNHRGSDWPEKRVEEAGVLYDSLLQGQSSVRSEFENHFRHFGPPFQAGDENTLSSLHAILSDLQTMTNTLLRGWLRRDGGLSLDFTAMEDTSNLIRSDTLMAFGQLCRSLRDSVSSTDTPPAPAPARVPAPPLPPPPPPILSARSSTESFRTARQPVPEPNYGPNHLLSSNYSMQSRSFRQRPTEIVTLSKDQMQEQISPLETRITAASNFGLPDVVVGGSDFGTLRRFFQSEEADVPTQVDTHSWRSSRAHLGSTRRQRGASNEHGGERENVMTRALSVIGIGSGTNNGGLQGRHNSSGSSSGRSHHQSDSFVPSASNSSSPLTSTPRTSNSVGLGSVYSPQALNTPIIERPRTPPSWPSPKNNYGNFCKGAWKLREGLSNAMRLRERPNGMFNAVYYWRCDKCVFEGVAHGPNKKNARFDNRVRLAHDIQYRWVFLAKSHFNKVTYTPDQSDPLGCIFCCAEGQNTPAFGNAESLLFHISQRHRNIGSVLSEGVLSRIKCVVGRVADKEEDFDVNIMPTEEVAELEAMR